MPSLQVVAVPSLRTASAVALPLSSTDTVAPRYVALRNTVSLASDLSGHASFTNLTVVASSTRVASIAFSADGVLSAEVTNVHVVSPVRRVEVWSQPPAVCDEGRVCADPPASVRLLDGLGRPVSGHYAVAFIFQELGARSVGGVHANSMRDWSSLVRGHSVHHHGKVLRGQLSTLSGPDGVASFPRLAFSSRGAAGRYSIWFGSSGAWSNATQLIAVRSAVAEVQVSVPSTS